VNIVGLGNCGCNLAEEFAKYPQYRVYSLDTELRDAKRFFLVEKKKHPEEYERDAPDVKDFLDCEGETLFILGGSGAISAMSLRVLETIKKNKIKILYIYADPDLLGEVQRLQQRATFHILQEYARSGIFEEIIIVDNNAVSDIVGEMTITEYYKKINEAIVPMVHFINVFNNSPAVMTTFQSLAEVSRIRTLGMVNVETGEEKLLFSLDSKNETRYYYAISEKSLKEDGSLHNKIRKQVKSKNERASFGIFETSYEHNFCYSLVCSREVAKL